MAKVLIGNIEGPQGIQGNPGPLSGGVMGRWETGSIDPELTTPPTGDGRAFLEDVGANYVFGVTPADLIPAPFDEFLAALPPGVEIQIVLVETPEDRMVVRTLDFFLDSVVEGFWTVDCEVLDGTPDLFATDVEIYAIFETAPDDEGSTPPDADTTTKGVQRNATDAEAITGTALDRTVTPHALAAALVAARGTGEINNQTGTSYTPVLTDVGKLVRMNNAALITVTLPQDSDVAFAVGSRIDFAGIGAGLIQFAAGSGATVHSASSTKKTRAQYAGASAWKEAANTWLVIGDLEA